MEALIAPVPVHIPRVFAAPSPTSAGSIPEAVLLPRFFYAPAPVGIQQSQDGDLSILSFDAVDDYLSLSGTDVTFTLQNSGVVAADSFTVDILHSEDDIIGNSDDSLIERFVIDAIAAQDTLTRTENIRLSEGSTIAQGEGFLAIQVDTNNRVVETDEENNISAIQGVGLDSIIVDTQRPTYTPSVSSTPGPSFSNFEVAFSEEVGSSADEIASYSLISTSSGAQAGEAIDIAPIDIASVDRIDESTLSIGLSAELLDGQYEFTVSSEVQDLAGNGIDAALDPFTFEIETPPDGSSDIPDESVLTQGGSYSTNLGLSASLALPGTEGVDVVLTETGAIAAVNTETGSSLHWIDPETGAIAQSIDFDKSIGDVAFDGDDVLAIAARDTLLTVDAATGSIISEREQIGITRVAISDDGYVGAIANRTVHLYDPDDALLFSKTLNYKAVTDIEIRTSPDSVGGNSVYISSFRNDYFTDIQGQRNPVQVAKLEAFDFTGEQQWKLFGDTSETIKQNVADTRLYRVTLGKDGYLYIGGESAGTATIFRWSGQPMTEDEQFGNATPFLSRIDRNSQLYNSGSAHIAYYARINPITGELVHSQVTFPRLSSSKSNTMYIGDIATSDSGTFYFGGTAYSSIKNRDSLTINDQPVGSYVSQDPAWMSIAPNFRTRNFWTALSDVGAKGIVQGVDAGYGYSAAISNLNSGTYPVTFGPNSGTVFISFTPEPRQD